MKMRYSVYYFISVPLVLGMVQVFILQYPPDCSLPVQEIHSPAGNTHFLSFALQILSGFSEELQSGDAAAKEEQRAFLLAVHYVSMRIEQGIDISDEAIAAVSQQDIVSLLELVHPESGIRCTAVEKLQADALPLITFALSDEDYLVRSQAIQALESINTPALQKHSYRS